MFPLWQSALFGSYTSLYIMIQTGISSLAFAFIVSMLIGVVLGLVNAVLINWLKLPPFIITLGTQKPVSWNHDYIY